MTQLAATQHSTHPSTKQRALALVNACEALREMGAMFCTLRLTAKLGPAIRGLLTHHVSPRTLSNALKCAIGCQGSQYDVPRCGGRWQFSP